MYMAVGGSSLRGPPRRKMADWPKLRLSKNKSSTTPLKGWTQEWFNTEQNRAKEILELNIKNNIPSLPPSLTIEKCCILHTCD
jgi:hypothetical protein